MKVAVYDRGILSEKAIERLGEIDEHFQVEGLFWGTEAPVFDGEVTVYNNLKDAVLSGEINALIIPDADKRIQYVLSGLNDTKSVRVFYASLNQIRSNGDFKLKEINFDKPWLDIMEYHVADFCNMNCKGCGHCANLIENAGFPDIDSYEKELDRLAELFDGIGLIRLLGGEPLLNPQLLDFLKLTRKYFPFSNLHLVTNGILLDEMSEELLRFIREESVIMDISLYPPMHGMEEEIRKALTSKGILFNIERIEYFYRRFMPCGGNDPERSFANCDSSANHLMYKGKIASCAMPFSVEILNKEYGYEVTHDAWIDLFDEHLDGWEINRRLKQASSLCSYCSSGLEEFNWAQRNGQDALESDWIYNG